MVSISTLSTSRLREVPSNTHSGIRVKATEGDTGTIKGVTYQKITLSGITK